MIHNFHIYGHTSAEVSTDKTHIGVPIGLYNTVSIIGKTLFWDIVSWANLPDIQTTQLSSDKNSECAEINHATDWSV